MQFAFLFLQLYSFKVSYDTGTRLPDSKMNYQATSYHKKAATV